MGFSTTESSMKRCWLIGLALSAPLRNSSGASSTAAISTDPPLPRGCNLASGKRCRLQDGTMHPEFLRSKERLEYMTPEELELWKEVETVKKIEENLKRAACNKDPSEVKVEAEANRSERTRTDTSGPAILAEPTTTTREEPIEGERNELAELMEKAGILDGYEHLRDLANGTTAAVIAELGRGWLLRSGSESCGLPKSNLMNLWRRIMGRVEDDAHQDKLVEGPERGCGDARLAAAAAVVGAGGPFAWERGPWSGPAFNACPLLPELLPGVLAGPDIEKGSEWPEPPMARVLRGCPMGACLRYGQTASSPFPQYILNDEAVDDISALFLNSSSVPIKGTKSQCFRLTGPREVILDAGKIRQKMITDDNSILCSKVHHAACCQGEWRPPGSKTVDGRVYCTGCLPYFIALGPEKTGTTDLYNRIGLMHGVVPSVIKETGYWTENIIPSQHKESLMSYTLKYFRELNGHYSGVLTASCASSDSREAEHCDAITGEATPSYLGWEHRGLAMVPRWLACAHPTVKLIVTLRDPVQRTYSDYHFFGRLQAARKSKLVKKITGLDGKEGAEAFVRQLSPESFDVWMREEVTELERCFVAYPDGRLVWMPPTVKSRQSWDCETIRVDQLGRHAVNAKRLPGRLLVSLYPLHLAKWLRFFPCAQLLVVRSAGAWSADALRPVARFLGVAEASAVHAAAADAVRPEQSAFNREAAGLGAGLSKQPMLRRTRHALQAFFEAHWGARFPEEIHQPEPCRGSL